MSRSSLAAIAFAVLAGCSSHAETVCQDIGDCSQGGDSVWIAACQGEAKSLAAEANDVGCGSKYDAYYACADASYVCQGATALFPGCDDALAALDACLAAATAGTSCVALASAETACGGGGTDGGPTPDAGPVARLSRELLSPGGGKHVRPEPAGARDLPGLRRDLPPLSATGSRSPAS